MYWQADEVLHCFPNVITGGLYSVQHHLTVTVLSEIWPFPASVHLLLALGCCTQFLN